MAQNISVNDDVKTTITSDLRNVAGTASNGTVSTTIQSSGTGANLTVSMVTTGGFVSRSDTKDCAELTELATDLQKHWEAVKAKIAELAAAWAEESSSSSSASASASASA